MKCKMIHLLYGIFPNNRWKTFLIKIHYSHCEKCQKNFVSDDQIKPLMISFRDISSDPGLWTDIEKAITANSQIRETIKTKYRLFLLPKWQWVAAALTVLLLIILIPPHFQKKRSETIQEASRNQIVLKSIKIGETPARTFFFQSKNPHRLIIWAKKAN